MKQVSEKIIVCYEYESQDESILHQNEMKRNNYTVEKTKTKSSGNKLIWYGKHKEIDENIDLKQIVLKAKDDIDNKYTNIVNEFLEDVASNIEEIAKGYAEEGRIGFVIINGDKCEIPSLMDKNRVQQIVSNAPNYKLIVKKLLDCGCKNVEILYDTNFNCKFKLVCNIL